MIFPLMAFKKSSQKRMNLETNIFLLHVDERATEAAKKKKKKLNISVETVEDRSQVSSDIVQLGFPTLPKFELTLVVTPELLLTESIDQGAMVHDNQGQW